MRIGIQVAFAGAAADPAHVRETARRAEAAGFHSIWVPEHVVLFEEYSSRYPYSADGKIGGGAHLAPPEPLTCLAFMAACTEKIRLGTGILIVPQRNPVYTAKQVADLDVLSGGRFDFGIGVGWLAEEFQALGVPFEHRGARADDYLRVMKALWTQETSSYDGEYYKLPPVVQNPKPVQRPHPPIYVGGESDAALSRVARLCQGWYGVGLTPETLPERLKVLDEKLGENNRTRKDIDVLVAPYGGKPDRDLIRRFEDQGVDEVVLFAMHSKRERVYQMIDDLAERLIARAA
jgi:probable F420-dependent oxidoreductase